MFLLWEPLSANGQSNGKLINCENALEFGNFVRFAHDRNQVQPLIRSFSPVRWRMPLRDDSKNWKNCRKYIIAALCIKKRSIEDLTGSQTHLNWQKMSAYSAEMPVACNTVTRNVNSFPICKCSPDSSATSCSSDETLESPRPESASSCSIS